MVCPPAYMLPSAQPGLRVVEDVAELVRRQAEVDHRVRRAHQRGGQGQLEAGRMVLVQERDAVPGDDALGAQRTRRAPDPVVELAPRSSGGRRS